MTITTVIRFSQFQPCCQTKNHVELPPTLTDKVGHGRVDDMCQPQACARVTQREERCDARDARQLCKRESEARQQYLTERIEESCTWQQKKSLGSARRRGSVTVLRHDPSWTKLFFESMRSNWRALSVLHLEFPDA